jgi:hypothetical protein
MPPCGLDRSNNKQQNHTQTRSKHTHNHPLTNKCIKTIQKTTSAMVCSLPYQCQPIAPEPPRVLARCKLHALCWGAIIRHTTTIHAN